MEQSLSGSGPHQGSHMQETTPASKTSRSSSRSKRKIRAPKRFDDEDDLYSASNKGKTKAGETSAVVRVRRLLTAQDITGALVKREVFVRWPEDKHWYQAVLTKVRVKEQKAQAFYPDTKETEDLDLGALVRAQEISLIELRKPDDPVNEGETVLDGPDHLEQIAEELGQAAGADDLENVDVDQPIWALSESVSGNLALKGEEDDASCCLQEAAAEIADSLLDPQQQPLKKAKITHDSLKAEQSEAYLDDAEDIDVDKPIWALSESDDLVASASASLVTEQLDLRNADMPEDVPKSPPGKETCLESTTQEPQVKVDSAADDPGSLSERNKDLGAEEWTQSMLADIMRQSGNGAGEECVVQKPETNDSEPGKEAQEAQAIEVGPSRQGSMPADSGPSAVRSKVVASLGESLMKAATEWGDNLKVEKPDILNQDLAKTIEQELYSLYGSVGKEYRAKFRSLHFNLKDPHNPQLRGRVIAGEVLPYDLVRMSAIELASKELNEWRNKKAAEFEKAVILDAVTAAKYSTAAAAEVQEKLKESGKVEVVGRSHTIEPSETADNVATENLPAESPHVDKESPPELPEISNLNAAIVPSLGQTRVANIASLRAVGAVTNTTTITSYPEAPQEHVSQSGGIAGSLSPSSDPEIRSPSLSPSISSTPEEWEGRLQVPGLGNLLVTVDQLGGLGNIGSFFPSGEAEIRGRVGNDKLEPFFEDLKSSRSRTVSLGIVRCSTEGDHATMEELVEQYVSKNRSGVAEPSEGTEIYFIPKGLLSARFCLTAKLSVPADWKLLVPGNISAKELLCVCVHRKESMLPTSKSLNPTVDTASNERKPPNMRHPYEDHEFSPPPDTPPTSPHVKDNGASSLPAFLSPGTNAVHQTLLKGQGCGQNVPKAAPTNAYGSGPHKLSSNSVPAGLDLKNLGALAAALRVQAQDSHASTSRPSPIISPLQDHAMLQKVLETGATTNAVDSAQHDNMMTRSMPASAMSSSQQGFMKEQFQVADAYVMHNNGSFILSNSNQEGTMPVKAFQPVAAPTATQLQTLAERNNTGGSWNIGVNASSINEPRDTTWKQEGGGWGWGKR